MHCNFDQQRESARPTGDPKLRVGIIFCLPYLRMYHKSRPTETD